MGPSDPAKLLFPPAKTTQPSLTVVGSSIPLSGRNRLLDARVGEPIKSCQPDNINTGDDLTSEAKSSGFLPTIQEDETVV